MCLCARRTITLTPSLLECCRANLQCSRSGTPEAGHVLKALQKPSQQEVPTAINTLCTAVLRMHVPNSARFIDAPAALYLLR